MPKVERENSKDKILKTAVKLFAEKGFDGTSIREICRDANVNISMISYFWGGKKELYQGIINSLVEKQTTFFAQFIDFNSDPASMPKKAQIKTLKTIINNIVDFFYSNISSDLIVFLVKEQQKNAILPNTPAFKYLRRLIASILQKDETDRIVVFKMLFILAQVNSPRIMPALSLHQLNQKDFIQEDIKIIKDNLNLYIDTMIKESENV